MVSGILLRIGIGVVAATILAAIVGFFLPSTFEVERSLVIEASPERIHQFTGDLTRWPEWVGWLQDDPDLAITLGPLTSGTGAGMSWASEGGEGSLTITRSDPAWGVAYDLVFSKNGYTSRRSLTYHQGPGGTEVRWLLQGDNGNNIMARYFVGLMPSLLGPKLDEGLARLKTLALEAEMDGVPEG
jgi:hypothetical protein